MRTSVTSSGGRHVAPAAAAGRDLTPAQRRTIQRMASGATATDAAAAAGVARQTVHRWLRDDPAFRAAFHAWQAAATDHARARLLALADAAVSTVAAAVAAGDTRTALAVLKGQGLLTPPTPGSTNPDHVARQQINAAARAECALVDAEMTCPGEIYAPAKVRAYRAAQERQQRPPAPPLPPVAAAADPADDLPMDILDPNMADLQAMDAAAAAAGCPTPEQLARLDAGLLNRD